jgi:hypothetical protein
MKATKLTPEQIEDRNYINYLCKCEVTRKRVEKARLKVMIATNKLYRMQLEVMKAGLWTPDASETFQIF